MFIDIYNFDKHIDSDNGAILFTKKGFSGLPDKVFEDHGFTIEFKNGEVVVIDIYQPEIAIPYLISEDKELNEKYNPAE